MASLTYSGLLSHGVRMNQNFIQVQTALHGPYTSIINDFKKRMPDIKSTHLLNSNFDYIKTDLSSNDVKIDTEHLRLNYAKSFDSVMFSQNNKTYALYPIYYSHTDPLRRVGKDKYILVEWNFLQDNMIFFTKDSLDMGSKKLTLPIDINTQKRIIRRADNEVINHTYFLHKGQFYLLVYTYMQHNNFYIGQYIPHRPLYAFISFYLFLVFFLFTFSPLCRNIISVVLNFKKKTKKSEQIFNPETIDLINDITNENKNIIKKTDNIHSQIENLETKLGSVTFDSSLNLLYLFYSDHLSSTCIQRLLGNFSKLKKANVACVALLDLDTFIYSTVVSYNMDIQASRNFYLVSQDILCFRGLSVQKETWHNTATLRADNFIKKRFSDDVFLKLKWLNFVPLHIYTVPAFIVFMYFGEDIERIAIPPSVLYNFAPAVNALRKFNNHYNNHYRDDLIVQDYDHLVNNIIFDFKRTVKIFCKMTVQLTEYMPPEEFVYIQYAITQKLLPKERIIYLSPTCLLILFYQSARSEKLTKIVQDLVPGRISCLHEEVVT